jgi:predicted nucleic acid-binding protein
MTYLVDANVLSEPTKPAPSSKVLEWLSENEQLLVVDSIILGELCVGILALAPGRKRNQLEQWFDALAQTIECLPWDASISRRWARLVVDLRRKGITLPLLDSMIAATALQHDLTIATRNTRDFGKAGLQVFDPFAERSDDWKTIHPK